ncbi:MAG: hypothetical protein LUH23_09060 [Oscillospiraceae bacterium]|nr:hypothetical protein [Oscillospiraceae bacterium]
MKSNTELYDNIAHSQDVIVTQKVDQLDKKASWEQIKKLFEGVNLSDGDIDSSRDEKFR